MQIDHRTRFTLADDEVVWYTSGNDHTLGAITKDDEDGWDWFDHRICSNHYRNSITLFQTQSIRQPDGRAEGYRLRLCEYLGFGCRHIASDEWIINARQMCGINKIALMAATAFPGRIEETIQTFRVAVLALVTEGDTLRSY